MDKGGAFCRNETLASERLRVQPLADQSMVGFKSKEEKSKVFPSEMNFKLQNFQEELEV